MLKNEVNNLMVEARILRATCGKVRERWMRRKNFGYMFLGESIRLLLGQSFLPPEGGGGKREINPYYLEGHPTCINNCSFLFSLSLSFSCGLIHRYRH